MSQQQGDTVELPRYFVSMYTDGPATRWNVIDRQTQEWVRRFASEDEAHLHAAACSQDVPGNENGKDFPKKGKDFP